MYEIFIIQVQTIDKCDILEEAFSNKSQAIDYLKEQGFTEEIVKEEIYKAFKNGKDTRASIKKLGLQLTGT